MVIPPTIGVPPSTPMAEPKRPEPPPLKPVKISPKSKEPIFERLKAFEDAPPEKGALKSIVPEELEPPDELNMFDKKLKIKLVYLLSKNNLLNRCQYAR
jgi:hypothetical protein